MKATQSVGHGEARIFRVSTPPVGSVGIDFKHPAKLTVDVFGEDGWIPGKAPITQPLAVTLEEP